MNHAELEELAAGYVLGALEPDDEHAFTEHLGGCPVCQATVGQYRGVVGQLGRGVPQVEPPRAVRSALRHQVGLSAARRGVLAFRPRVSGLVIGRIALVLGVLALFGLSFWNFTLRNRAAYYAQFEEVAVLASQPDARTVRLLPPGGGTARATVIALDEQDEGVLLVEGLPGLREGRVYRLWTYRPGEDPTAQAIRGPAWLPARELQPVRFTRLALEPDTGFFVTEESRTGSRQPSSEHVLTSRTGEGS